MDPTTDLTALPAEFAAVLGPEQFRKFVFELEVCRSRGRLKYWMQAAWDGFAAGHPDRALSFAELAEVLRVCRVHVLRLTRAAVRLVGADAPVRYTDEYHIAWSAGFPHSYAELPADYPHSTVVTDVYLCPACRTARDEWERHTPSPELAAGRVRK